MILLTIKASVFLTNGFFAKGRALFRHAEIGGDLNCSNGKIINHSSDGGGIALDVVGAKIAGSLYLTSGFFAGRQVLLRYAEIGQDLDCRNGRIVNRTGDGKATALDAVSAKIRGFVRLTEGFLVKGGFWLRYAEIGGDLDCSKGKIVNRTGDGQGSAIDALGAKIRGLVRLTDGFFAEGGVLLRGAEIGGDLDCSKGKIINRTGDGQGSATDALGAKIRGLVRLTDGFFAEGRVLLRGAEIGGDLNCSKGKIINHTSNGEAAALEALGAKVRGYIFLRDSFVAEGSVILANVEVGADLDCSKGHFTNFTEDGQGRAISASGAQINGSVFIDDGFRAEGVVNFIGARVGRQLSCAGGYFSNAAPAKAKKQKAGRPPLPIAEVALQFQGIKVGDFLFLGPRENRPDEHLLIKGSLSLVGAYAREFVDHPKSRPPEVIEAANGDKLLCCVQLDGFICDRLNPSVDAMSRKKWLRRGSPDDLGNRFSAQPFGNVVRVFRAMGHEKDARLIAEDAQKYRHREWSRRASWFTWMTLGPWWWAFGRFVGYGYRPEWLLSLLFVIWLSCAVFYEQAAKQGVMAPSQSALFLNEKAKFDNCRRPNGAWTECIGRLVPEYTKFNGYVYSADLILPIVDLQQKRAWEPTWEKMQLGIQTPYWVPWALVWFETICGWVGSLVVAAVLSGTLLRRYQS